MRTFVLLFALAASFSLFLSGCGDIKGPRFWWDDRNQERLPDGFSLPSDPSEPNELHRERAADPSGRDLTDQDLDDYRTDFDYEEQRAQERNVPQGFMDRNTAGNRQ